MSNIWNPQLYDNQHDFISQYGRDVVKLLNPQKGETILDLGCGTGHLTQSIYSLGSIVTGIDASVAMITQAKEHYPHLNFKVQTGENLDDSAQFDGVFSNAALHWMKDAQKVAENIVRSLKPQGRFVAEFGGKGNINTIIQAINAVLEAKGHGDQIKQNPWYFPSIGEYSTVLENVGLEVQVAYLYDRPTLLNEKDQGLKNWLKMFATPLFQGLSPEKITAIVEDVEKAVHPKLYQDGKWYADYRRIRIKAVKC